MRRTQRLPSYFQFWTSPETLLWRISLWHLFHFSMVHPLKTLTLSCLNLIFFAEVIITMMVHINLSYSVVPKKIHPWDGFWVWLNILFTHGIIWSLFFLKNIRITVKEEMLMILLGCKRWKMRVWKNTLKFFFTTITNPK